MTYVCKIEWKALVWKFTWFDNKVRELIAGKVLHNSLLNTTVVASIFRQEQKDST